jgi:hypothetical protein
MFLRPHVEKKIEIDLKTILYPIIQKMSTHHELKEFLAQYLVESPIDSTHVDLKTHNHYYVPLEARQKLYKIVNQEIFEHGRRCYLYERLGKHRNLKIILDDNVSGFDQIVKTCNKVIRNILSVENKHLRAYVLTNSDPKGRRSIIVYPHIRCKMEAHRFLMKALSDCLPHEIDVGVLNCSLWPLYGCSKNKKSTPYLLSHYYDHRALLVNKHSAHTTRQLIEMFATHPELDICRMKNDEDEDEDEEEEDEEDEEEDEGTEDDKKETEEDAKPYKSWADEAENVEEVDDEDEEVEDEDEEVEDEDEEVEDEDEDEDEEDEDTEDDKKEKKKGTKRDDEDDEDEDSEEEEDDEDEDSEEEEEEDDEDDEDDEDEEKDDEDEESEEEESDEMDDAVDALENSARCMNWCNLLTGTICTLAMVYTMANATQVCAQHQ